MIEEIEVEDNGVQKKSFALKSMVNDDSKIIETLEERKMTREMIQSGQRKNNQIWILT
jgi:hypothetical protein